MNHINGSGTSSEGKSANKGGISGYGSGTTTAEFMSQVYI